MSRIFRIVAALLFLAAFVSTASAMPDAAVSPSVCIGCHGGKISASAFDASVHGKNGCISCHVDLAEVEKHEKGELMPGKVQCERCHRLAASQYLVSVHAANGTSCTDCHTGIHSITPWKNDKRIRRAAPTSTTAPLTTTSPMTP